MTGDSPSLWPRPHFQSGGGDPFLFYVIYGPVPKDFSVSRSKYRCTGIPQGISVMAYGPGREQDVPRNFQEGYLWEDLCKGNPALADAVEAQDECVVISGSVEDPEDLNYLRNVIGLTQWMLDAGGVAVFDPQSFRWWSPAQWRSKAFEPNSPDAHEHVLILSSEGVDGDWLHTRGLRKFGRPDLSFHNVGPEHLDAAVATINRFIEFQALGGVIPESQPVRSDGLPDGLLCRHRGHLEDPDFNNVHVEIVWPD